MKKSLLTRFRWPIFVAVFSSSQTAGIAYLYHDTHTAMISFVVAVFSMAVAVVLNTIDETSNTIE